MPLTPSGKLNRAGLPPPDLAPARNVYKAPATPEEAALANIWAVLLGIERPGVDDDFFALGGHSLLATQLLSRIRDQFSVEIPLNTLFEQPTIAGLAAALDTLRWALNNDDDDATADLEDIEV